MPRTLICMTFSYTFLFFGIKYVKHSINPEAFSISPSVHCVFKHKIDSHYSENDNRSKALELH